MGMGLLEGLGQKIEEHPPEVGIYGMKPSVEASLGDCLVDISVLVQKRPRLLDVAAEEGSREKGCAHHLGGGEAELLVIAMAYCVQELLAEVVGGDYGIAHDVLPVRKSLVAFKPGGYCLPG